MPKKPEKHCLSCGKIIIAGRTDKRYCDDVCRACATRKRVKFQALMEFDDKHQAVIRAIKQNYKLLKKAMGGREEWIVDYVNLYFDGFNPMYHTGSELLENGILRHYCFELGWVELDEAKLLVTIFPERLVTFDPNIQINVPPDDDDEYLSG